MKPDVVAYLLSQFEKQLQADAWGSLASQPSLLVRTPGQEKALLKKQKQKN